MTRQIFFMNFRWDQTRAPDAAAELIESQSTAPQLIIGMQFGAGLARFATAYRSAAVVEIIHALAMEVVNLPGVDAPAPHVIQNDPAPLPPSALLPMIRRPYPKNPESCARSPSTTGFAAPVPKPRARNRSPKVVMALSRGYYHVCLSTINRHGYASSRDCSEG